MNESSNERPPLSGCQPDCGHTDEEHKAFDAGYYAGLEGDGENPYLKVSSELAEVWEIGWSVSGNYSLR